MVDPLPLRLLRRTLTVPAFVVGLVASIAILPLALLVLPVLDLARGNRFTGTRAALILPLWLLTEVLGMGAALALLLVAWHPRWSLAGTLALQHAWAATLLGIVRLGYRMPLYVEGEEALRPGPFLLLVRQTSPFDLLLPLALVAGRHDVRVRKVVRLDALWDPCLDVLVHRLPSTVLTREGSSARLFEHLAPLARDLASDEALLDFPEGARFSQARRKRALDRLDARGELGLTAKATAMRYVLPPRPGAALALLRAAPDVDVVLMGHVGFDGARRFRHFFAGGLVGRPLRVKYWRYERAGIPTDEDACVDWLFARWQAMDDWVGRHRR